MKNLAVLGVLIVAGCASSPPPATTVNGAAGVTGQPGVSSAATMYQSASLAGGDIQVPKVDLGSPLPIVRVNDLHFSDGNSSGGSVGAPGVPNLSPANSGNALSGAPNGPATPEPIATPSKSVTPLMTTAMPGAAQPGAAQLPTLLGIGHGGNSLWALVNDSAHAILRVGDKVAGTKITSISNAGVELADGREMTVAWTGASGTQMGGNIVPNIDSSQKAPPSGVAPNVAAQPQAGGTNGQPLPPAAPSTRPPTFVTATAPPMNQAAANAPPAGVSGVNSPLNTLATPASFQNNPPSSSGITP